MVQVDTGLGVAVDDTELDDVGGDEIAVSGGVDVATDLDSAQIVGEGDGKVDVVLFVRLEPCSRLSSSHHSLRRMCITPIRQGGNTGKRSAYSSPSSPIQLGSG